MLMAYVCTLPAFCNLRSVWKIPLFWDETSRLHMPPEKSRLDVAVETCSECPRRNRYFNMQIVFSLSKAPIIGTWVLTP